jgi:tRNA nucleotidyltransferase (CCA-adding enzyme)
VGTPAAGKRGWVGMKIYLVGGAVRDELLNITAKDRDFVVVGATPAEMLSDGYIALDGDFPVFLHPETKEEYALARREKKVSGGYRGFTVESTPDVTLEEDLIRRDLTINAMAKDLQTGEIIDPFSGQQDLNDGYLRHVSPAFVEDPVRVLRVARFAARFAQWGFRLAHGTHALLKKISASGELSELTVERLWQETERALSEKRPDRYFHVLHRCGALAILFPEISEKLVEIETHNETQKQRDDLLISLEKISQQSNQIEIRFAGMLSGFSVSVLESFCRRLKLTKNFQLIIFCVARNRSMWLSLNMDPTSLIDFYQRLDAWRQIKIFRQFVVVMDVLDNITQVDRKAEKVLSNFEKAHSIHARDLDLSGLKGAQIANKLYLARIEALQ